MPCLQQTSAIMILHLSLSSVIRSKAMLSLLFPVTKELKLSRNVILCLPLLLVPSILPVRDKNSSLLLRVLKTYVWSILLYGCETWTITAETKKNLEAAEMWFYRRMLRISWKEKRTNESILEETNQERSLINTIRKRQLKFLGQ